MGENGNKYFLGPGWAKGDKNDLEWVGGCGLVEDPMPRPVVQFPETAFSQTPDEPPPLEAGFWPPSPDSEIWTMGGVHEENR